MYVLYNGPLARGLLVEMVMAEGGIAYEARMVDICRNEHRAPEYLAINPAGWVPALVTPEGEFLYETPAINLYLAERHDLVQLAPRVDELERGLFLSGLFYLTNDLEPWMKRVFYPERFVLRENDGPAMRERSIDGALDRLGVIEQRLRDRGPYHLGDRFSLVDLTMTYWAVYLAAERGLAPYPEVRRCMTLVMDRPRLRARFAEHRASTNAGERTDGST
jgi:glutathione S-transferase